MGCGIACEAIGGVRRQYMTTNPRYILDNTVLRLTAFGCEARTAVERDNSNCNNNNNNNYNNNNKYNNNNYSNNRGMGGSGGSGGGNGNGRGGVSNGKVTYSPLAVLNVQVAKCTQHTLSTHPINLNHPINSPY